jgi:uroporphyrinogen decarboxylase
MADWVVPLHHPKPDRERFIGALLGKVTPPRPPLIEYLMDEALRRPITTELMGREWVSPGGDRASQAAYWDNFVAFWHHLGYDYVRLELGLGFAGRTLVGADATMVSEQRSWVDEHQGAITSEDDFETYPWPSVDEVDLFPLEYISAHLPDGLGLITNHGSGPFEIVTQVMSYEGFCLALYDNPTLVRAVCERVGSLLLAYYRQLVDLPNLIALFQGDDMGFRSGPLAPPQVLRELFLPWHQRFAQLAHDHGVPYFLHSCGEISSIMPDLIDTVGIDGKHSFEDAILPAPEFQRRYGDRLATLGGVDVGILAGGTPEQVRARTRELLSACAPAGRYAIGSGNSIPSYIPVENYLTMLDAALTWEQN